MTVLVTGCAGFIGHAASAQLLAQGVRVVGIDNVNDYYDPRLKRARLETIERNPNFTFLHGDIKHAGELSEIFSRYKIKRVLHLAAQAGVRYSITHPQVYVDSNLVGFMNILEACRHAQVEHLVFASSSSVYGANTKRPYSESDRVDQPVSLYAATKKSNEMLAYSYSHLYGMPITGLRYFTVYGPWGRPDMAPYRFVDAIQRGFAIDVYNHGEHQRDFTYIDDIVAGSLRVLDHVPVVDAANALPYRVYNIGYGQPRALGDFIELIERALGRQAEKRLLPKQPGDVDITWADTQALQDAVGYQPTVPLEVGIERFVAWYQEYSQLLIPSQV